MRPDNPTVRASGVRVVADAADRGQPAVPDLGPAPVPDQLTVLVFDAYRDGVGQGLTEELAAVRRGLP